MSLRFLAALTLAATLIIPVAPATAATYTFTATLSGPNEEPPNDSPATGFSRVVLDTVAHTLEIYAIFSGLVAPTTAAHIHAPTAVPFEGNTGVAVHVPSLAGFPLGVTAGTYLETFDTTNAATYNPAYVTDFGGGTVAGAEAALLAALVEGRAYFNIHSQTFVAGEIRGFFVPLPQPIPLPAALPLLLAALGVLALVRRRRQA